jgi:hypothetical protein
MDSSLCLQRSLGKVSSGDDRPLVIQVFQRSGDRHDGSSGFKSTEMLTSVRISKPSCS